MPQISFGWVNDGGEFNIGSLPVKGQKEIVGLKTKRSRALAGYAKAVLLSRRASLLAVKKLLDRYGVEKAKSAWEKEAESLLGPERKDEYTWPTDKFSESLNAWISDYILIPLRCKTAEEAEQKINKESEEIDLVAVSEEAEKLQLDTFITELYWRLRNTKPQIDSIQTTNGSDLPLTKDALEEVVSYPDDLVTLRRATARRIEPIPLSEEFDDSQVTEEAIQKN